MAIVSTDGLVLLSPSRLALLICPRRGKVLLEEPKGDPGVPARVGRAAHRVLATLCRNGEWPKDAFELIPSLVRAAVQKEWTPSLGDERYLRAVSDLTETLREFAFSWEPPVSAKRPYVESWVEFEDTPSHLRITGRLDMLISPPDVVDGWAQVLDFKSGEVPPDVGVDEAEPPLAIVAQAVLGRARLAIRCPVRVRNIYLRNCSEQRWELDQRALVDGWKRLRNLASDILADRWPAVPGADCERCRLGDGCEWAPRAVDAEQLGLEDDHGVDR